MTPKEFKLHIKAKALIVKYGKERAIEYCQNNARDYMEMIRDQGFYPLDCPKQLKKDLILAFGKDKNKQKKILSLNDQIIYWTDLKSIIKNIEPKQS
jgi:hypothetical protein